MGICHPVEWAWKTVHETAISAQLILWSCILCFRLHLWIETSIVWEWKIWMADRRDFYSFDIILRMSAMVAVCGEYYSKFTTYLEKIYDNLIKFVVSVLIAVNVSESELCKKVHIVKDQTVFYQIFYFVILMDICEI